MIDYGTVSILMCTYNGEKYIEQQLESIHSQSYTNWALYISDDGSTDRTLEIIQAFAAKLPPEKVNVFKGPGKGFAENFLFLLRNRNISSRYYAFSDQDDIWINSKLEMSTGCVNSFEKCGNNIVLYGGRTTLIDNNLNKKGLSPLFKKEMAFNNALIQSFSGGNTMLFNDALKKLAEKLPSAIEIVSHDWFLYILCSGAGGKVYYDPTPLVLYRQHDENLVGSNNSLSSKFIRLKKLFSGEFKKWTAINEASLSFYKVNLTPYNQDVLYAFKQCGDRNWFIRLKAFIAAKLYRQSIIETAVFMLMSVLNKLK